MKIDGLNQQMSEMQMQASGVAKPATGADVSSDFSQLLGDALSHVNALQADSSTKQSRFDMGDHSLSLSDVMIARNKASVSFEATVQVRNKLVEAYQELMRMTV